MYCRECGKEIDDSVEYCPNCGARVRTQDVRYRKPESGRWDSGKTVALIIGGLLLMMGVPIIIGGTALYGVTNFLDQGDGYIGVQGVDFETDTQALVVRDLDIRDFVVDDIDRPPEWIWSPDAGDLVSFRLNAESNTGKPIFIGIALEEDARGYIGSAEYDEITEFRMENPRENEPYIEYDYHQGDEITQEPTSLDIWEVQTSGPGTQTLTWSPEPGEYWLVVMNTDSSEVVDVEAGLAVKVPILTGIAQGLLFGGIVLVGVGIVVIYYGIIRPR